MVGGEVIEVILLPDKAWVNTRERVARRRPEECAIYVERNRDAEAIRAGDSLWWQGGDAYWTPATREFADRPIPRRGYSGVRRPGGGSEGGAR